LDGRDLPRLIFEQFMIHSRFGLSPDAERNIAHDIVHDSFDTWTDLAAFCVS
jgi:hypothetical protein